MIWIGSLFPFSASEIEAVVKNMALLKAPGPNDLNAFFFQKYWIEVGATTVNLCLNILNGEEMIGGLNSTSIVPNPKNIKPKTMYDFRPSSLCNVIYNIIATILANWLKSVLNHVISPSQSTFILGRLITNNALICFECTHFLKNRRTRKSGVAEVKLDMSKAYDWVEWSYLQ